MCRQYLKNQAHFKSNRAFEMRVPSAEDQEQRTCHLELIPDSSDLNCTKEMVRFIAEQLRGVQ